MFFYIVLTPISITSGLWSTGNTRKNHQIDVYIYQCDLHLLQKFLFLFYWSQIFCWSKRLRFSPYLWPLLNRRLLEFPFLYGFPFFIEFQFFFVWIPFFYRIPVLFCLDSLFFNRIPVLDPFCLYCMCTLSFVFKYGNILIRKAFFNLNTLANCRKIVILAVWIILTCFSCFTKMDMAFWKLVLKLYI